MADSVVQKLSQPDSPSIQKKTQAAKPAATVGTLPPIQQKTIQENASEQEVEADTEELVQKKPVFESAGQSEDEPNVQRTCDSCAEEETLQAKSETATNPQTIESRLNSSKGSGSPLPKDTRGNMEHAFGSDFGGVRVHTGSDAVQMNRDLNAQAFTHGSDIYFNSGKYDTSSQSGQHLLAHELTHTVQQNGTAVQPRIRKKGEEQTNTGPSMPDLAGGRRLLAHELTHVVQQNGGGLQRARSGAAREDGHSHVQAKLALREPSEADATIDQQIYAWTGQVALPRRGDMRRLVDALMRVNPAFVRKQAEPFRGGGAGSASAFYKSLWTAGMYANETTLLRWWGRISGLTSDQAIALVNWIQARDARSRGKLRAYLTGKVAWSIAKKNYRQLHAFSLRGPEALDFFEMAFHDRRVLKVGEGDFKSRSLNVLTGKDVDVFLMSQPPDLTKIKSLDDVVWAIDWWELGLFAYKAAQRSYVDAEIEWSATKAKEMKSEKYGSVGGWLTDVLLPGTPATDVNVTWDELRDFYLQRKRDYERRKAEIEAGKGGPQWIIDKIRPIRAKAERARKAFTDGAEKVQPEEVEQELMQRAVVARGILEQFAEMVQTVGSSINHYLGQIQTLKAKEKKLREEIAKIEARMSRGFFGKVWDGVKSAVSAFVKALKSVDWLEVLEIVVDIVGTVVAGPLYVLAKIAFALKRAVDLIAEITEAVSGFKDFETRWNDIKGPLDGLTAGRTLELFVNIMTGGPSPLGKLAEKLAGLKKWSRKPGKKLMGKLKGAVRGVIGLVEAVAGIEEKVIGKAQTLIVKMLILLGPVGARILPLLLAGSKKLGQVHTALTEGIQKVKGVVALLMSPKELLGKAADAIAETVKGAANKLMTTVISYVLKKLPRLVGGLYGKIISAATGALESKIKGAIRKFVEKYDLGSTLKGLFDPLVAPLTRIVDRVVRPLAPSINAAMDKAKAFLQKLHPNAWFADDPAEEGDPTLDRLPPDSGKPLEPVLRTKMEGHFGADFGPVRVHTDTAAAAATRSLGARAVTRGADIYFANGRYAPESRRGRHLLAHELTHVVQQRAVDKRSFEGERIAARSARPQANLVAGPQDSTAEREADQVADRVAAGHASGDIIHASSADLDRGVDDTLEGRLGKLVKKVVVESGQLHAMVGDVVKKSGLPKPGKKSGALLASALEALEAEASLFMDRVMNEIGLNPKGFAKLSTPIARDAAATVGAEDHAKLKRHVTTAPKATSTGGAVEITNAALISFQVQIALMAARPYLPKTKPEKANKTLISDIKSALTRSIDRFDNLFLGLTLEDRDSASHTAFKIVDTSGGRVKFELRKTHDDYIVPGNEFIIPAGKFAGYVLGGDTSGDLGAGDAAWKKHSDAAAARTLKWEKNRPKRRTRQLSRWNAAAKAGKIPSWLKVTSGKLNHADIPDTVVGKDDLKDKTFEVDHVIEHQMGGPDEVINYQLIEPGVNKSVGPTIQRRIDRFAREHRDGGKDAKKLLFVKLKRGT